MAKTMGLDLTTGPITKKLISFTLPFLAATLLQTAYSTVDMVVVGQYVGSVGSVAVDYGVIVANDVDQYLTSFAEKQ